MNTMSMELVELSQDEIDSISGAGSGGRWRGDNAAFGTAVGAQIGGAVTGGNGTAILVGSGLGLTVGGLVCGSNGGGK